MLGVVAYDQDDPADDLLREFAREIGVEDTYAKTRVGVLLGGGAPGETDRPTRSSAAPGRSAPSCERCGRCMIGCPLGAKNTLVKNYLYLAEQAGADVFPERLVVDVKPLGAPDGSEGYEVTTEHPGAWLRRRRRTFTARGVVFAAGPLGTNKLLASCRLHGSLPRVSDRIGKLVRTNSEAILAVTLPPDAPDIQKRVAITGSIYPDPDTHIETVVYGDAADSMSSLYTVLVGDGTRVTRPLKLLGAAARAPGHVPEAAQPARLVAPHDHRARDADARQRDRAAGAADAARRAAADRATTASGRSRRSSRSPTSSPPGWPSAPAASRRPR